MAEKWACNATQWIRTALTDMYHALGQVDAIADIHLANRYRAIIGVLTRQEKYLQDKYGVNPATGVGKRLRRDPAALTRALSILGEKEPATE